MIPTFSLRDEVTQGGREVRVRTGRETGGPYLTQTRERGLFARPGRTRTRVLVPVPVTVNGGPTEGLLRSILSYGSASVTTGPVSQFPGSSFVDQVNGLFPYGLG